MDNRKEHGQPQIQAAPANFTLSEVKATERVQDCPDFVLAQKDFRGKEGEQPISKDPSKKLLEL